MTYKSKVHEDVEIKYKYIRAEPKKPIETSFILPSDQNSKEHIDRRLPNTRLQVSRGYDLFTGEDTVVKIKIYRTVITNGIQTEMRLAANIILLLKPHQQKQKVRGFDGSNEMIIRLNRA